MQENPDNCTLCVVIISTINNFNLLRHHLFLPSSFTKFLYCYNKCKKLIQWNQIAIYTQPSLSSSLFSSAQFLKYVKEIIRETHIIVYQYTFLVATHTHIHTYINQHHEAHSYLLMLQPMKQFSLSGAHYCHRHYIKILVENVAKS